MYAEGYMDGNTAQNISVGFVPTTVRVVNRTGRDEMWEADLNQTIGFTSGGTLEIFAGYKIGGATNGWEAIVAQVVLGAGSWAGGDAAGWFILEPGTLDPASPTITAETIRATEFADVAPTGNFATAVANLIPNGIEMSGTFASESGLTPYYGSPPGNARGFSVTTALGSAGDLLKWHAWAANAVAE